jgi:hypothetical protein
VKDGSARSVDASPGYGGISLSDAGLQPRGGNALGPSIWQVVGENDAANTLMFTVGGALREMSRWMRLAHIAGENNKPEPIRLQGAGPFASLLAKVSGNSAAALSPACRQSLAGPFPTLLFASAHPAAVQHVKRASDKATCCVWFGAAEDAPEADLVIDPTTLIGDPVFFSPEAVEQAEQDWLNLSDEPGLRVHVRVNAAGWDSVDCEAFLADLARAVQPGARLWISSMQQTPTAVRERLRQFAEAQGARMWESIAVDGPNPTLGRFLFAHLAFLAEDDRRSQSEAAYFGVPILLAGRTAKRGNSGKTLIASGNARRFEGELTPWRCEPMREVDKAADQVVKRLLERYPPARW